MASPRFLEELPEDVSPEITWLFELKILGIVSVKIGEKTQRSVAISDPGRWGSYWYLVPIFYKGKWYRYSFFDGQWAA